MRQSRFRLQIGLTSCVNRVLAPHNVSRHRLRRRSEKARCHAVPATDRDVSRVVVREATYVERLAYTRAQAVAALGLSRSIRDEHADGRSLAEVARALNADGVPTSQGGRAWWPSTVRTVLVRSTRRSPPADVRARRARGPAPRQGQSRSR
jgi:hypothetical protein